MTATDHSGTAPVPEGLLHALRGSLRDGVQLVRVRLELFGVEAREHALATVEMLIAGLAAVLFLFLGLAFLAVLITVLLWDSQRVLALTVFATVFLTLGAIALLVLRRRWRASQRWFESSLEELRQDGERLVP